MLLLEGGILGRTDDMIHVRGNNLYPAAIEAVVRQFPEVAEFRLIVDRSGPLTDLSVEIELIKESMAVADAVARAIRDELLFRVPVIALPAGTPYANLNTATFDGDGDLWFTGQGGFVGKVQTKTGQVSVKSSPRGTGPYGICTTPKGDVWYCSLAGSFIARIDRASGD